MNWYKISEASEMLKLGGFLEPPPVMLEEINDWVREQLGPFIFYNLTDLLKNDSNFIDRYKEENAFKEMTLKRYKENLTKYNILSKNKQITEKLPDLNSRKYSVEKIFEVKLQGWKYNYILERAGQDAVDRLQYYDTIKVKMLQADPESKVGANWNPNSNTIVIFISRNITEFSEEIYTLIRHELSHFSQHLIDRLLRTKNFGRPNTRIRNPSITQNDSEDKLIRFNIGKEDAYPLDDVEFYTNIYDIYLELKKELIEIKSNKESFTKPIYVYFNNLLNYYDFLQTLKKYNYGKYKKAVTILSRILNEI